MANQGTVKLYEYFKHNFINLETIALTDRRDVDLYFYTGMMDNKPHLIEQALNFVNVPRVLTFEQRIYYFQLYYE